MQVLALGSYFSLSPRHFGRGTCPDWSQSVIFVLPYPAILGIPAGNRSFPGCQLDNELPFLLVPSQSEKTFPG
jgi:hypothetical protein